VRNIFPAILVFESKGDTIMYCNACGKVIAEDGHFCSYCGNVVGIPPTSKKLMRSRDERKIAGVCAGLAQHFDLDVTLVRIVCVFLTLATGVCPGIVTYLLAWIIVPAEPELKPLLAAQQPLAS
jgi:phage shock protein PspC (stress-responsive transcriptional regulator)